MLLTKVKKGFRMLLTGNYKHVLKVLKARFLKVNHDTVVETGVVNPVFVEVVPTLRCNLNCKMCHQRDIRKHDKSELSYDKIVKLLDNLERLGIKRISFLGGEVYVMKDIDRILELFNKRGFLVTLATNGFLLTDERIKMIAGYNNILQVVFSIDGLEKTHDAIRGVKGSFNRTVNAISKLKAKGVNVQVVTVIQKDNLEELSAVARLLKGLGLERMDLIWQNYASKKDIQLTEKILEQLSDSEVRVFLSPQTGLPDYTLKQVKKSLADLEKTGQAIGLGINYGSKDYVKELYDGSIRKKKVSCSSLVNGALQVDWRGELNLCPFIGVKKLGRLTGRNVNKEVFNSELFKKLRKSLLKGRLLPICDRCCALIVRE